MILVLVGVGRGQLTTSQVSQGERFERIWCFAGQVRVNGKQLTFRSVQVFVPNNDQACCGKLVRQGKTDQHGHFLIEPLEAGEYYAKFDNRGQQEVVGFGVLQRYDKCDAGHVEIRFLPDGRSTIQQYIDLDVDLSACDPEEAACYRR
jgi:hypothetical protein